MYIKSLINKYPVLPEDKLRKLIYIYQSVQDTFPKISKQSQSSNLVDCLDGNKIRRMHLTDRQKIALKARDRIIISNIGLITSCVDRYKDYTQWHEDLIQYGVFGLCKAVDTFNLDRNVKFSTYATWKVRQFIYVGSVEGIRLYKIPSSVVEQVRVLTEVRETCLSKTGSVSIMDMAKELVVENLADIQTIANNIQEIMIRTQQPSSLCQVLEDSDNYDIDITDTSQDSISLDPKQVTKLLDFCKDFNIPEEQILFASVKLGHFHGEIQSFKNTAKILNWDYDHADKIYHDFLANMTILSEFKLLGVK